MKNYLNAMSTFVATLLPMVFTLASDIVSWTSWLRNKCRHQKPKWTFYLHLPLLPIAKNIQMVTRYSHLLRDKEQWMSDLENFKEDSNEALRLQIHNQLDLPGSPKGFLISMSKENMEKLINKLIDDKSYQGLEKMLPRLLSNIGKLRDESVFSSENIVSKSEAIKQLMEASIKLKDKEITKHECAIATFNLNEGLLEAAPQALLQTSIQMRDGKFFNRKSTNM